MSLDLKKILALSNGALKLDPSNLGDLAKVFSAAIGVDSITIGGATVNFADADASAEVKGTTSLFGTSNLSVSSEFKVSAEDELSVSFSLEGSIGLRALMSQVIPAIPAPAELIINSLTVELNPGDSYSVKAEFAESPSWNLDLGPGGVTISDVVLSLSRKLPDASSGEFTGTIDFGDGAKFDVTYDLPGDFEINGSLPNITLLQLIAKLANKNVSLPGGFDVSLSENDILIKKSGGDLEFNLATKINEDDYAAFEVQKSGGEWGFALGLDIGEGGLAGLSGLSGLKPVDEFIGLENLLLVATSIEAPDFSFTNFDEFENPKLSGAGLSLPDGGLVVGLNVYAKLSTGGSKAFNTVSNFLKLPLDGTIEVVLQIGEHPSQNSKLAITVNETVQSGITVSGTLGGMLQGGEIEAFLSGSLDLEIQGSPVDFGITLLVLENGVLISGGYLGTIDFAHYFSLSDLNVIVGIDYEGIPSIGVAGQLDIPAASFDSSLAVFFDSDDPAKSLVAGAVSDLSLKDIVDHLAGSASIPNSLQEVLASIAIKGLHAFDVEGVGGANLLSSLAQRDLKAISSSFSSAGSITIPSSSSDVLLVEIKKGNSWSLTDMTTMTHYLLNKQSSSSVSVSLEAQLYVAPAATQIGEITFPEGYHLIGELDFLFLKAKTKIVVDTDNGVAADVDIAPIVLLNESFLAVTGANGKGGPEFSLATYEQPSEIPAFQPPHLYISGQLSLLGFEKESLLVSISEKGFHFSLTDTPNPAVTLSLHADFDSLTNMDGGGSVKVGVDEALDFGKLGSIKVDVSVDGAVELGLKDSEATANLSASFEFEGQSFTIASFALSVSTAPLEPSQLKKLIVSKVEDALKGFLSHAGQWLLWESKKVFTGAEKTAKEVGAILSSEFKLTSAAIAKKTKQILGYATDDVTTALLAAGASVDDAAKALQQAGFVATDVGTSLKNVYGASANTAAKALKGANYTANQVGGALKSAYGATGKEAAKAMEAAGYGANQVANALKGTFSESVGEVGDALHFAGYGASATAGALKSAFGSSAQTAGEIANVLKNSFGIASSSALKGILKGAGFVGSAVGSIVDKIFPHVKIGHVKLPFHVKSPF